jgi:hypothetical protein
LDFSTLIQQHLKLTSLAFMRISLFIALFVASFASATIGASPPAATSSIQFLGRSRSSVYDHGTYWVEGDWWDYRFSLTNRSPHSVYYYVHRRDVDEIAGQPHHHEQFRRWGRWGRPEYQLRDVRTVFRRIRPGETVNLVVTREPGLWPWRMCILAYEKPTGTHLRTSSSASKYSIEPHPPN